MGAGSVTLSGGLSLAEIGAAVGPLSWSFRVGEVAQLSFALTDVGARVSRAGLLAPEVTLRHDGLPWEVGAVERAYRGADVDASVEVRSRLARRLRSMTGRDVVKDVTPKAWIEPRVRKAGGRALVQPGAKRRTVVQKANQSVLDVIKALAGDTSTQWVEFGDMLFVGTPWWAFQGRTGLPTWQVRVDGVDPVLPPPRGRWALPAGVFSCRESADDREESASGSLSVPMGAGGAGVWLRPWHRVDVQGAVGEDAGLWLVTGVDFTEGEAAVSVTLSRPRKSAPQDGSSGSGGSGTGIADLDVGESGWIQGADRVWPRCSRTPRQAVEFGLANLGPSAYGNRRCLAWVSVAFSGAEGLGGSLARYVWERAPEQAAKSPKDFSPPAGAVVVWDSSVGDGAGHVGISIGAGKFVSATSGAIRVDELRAWSGGYYGAMSPSF